MLNIDANSIENIVKEQSRLNMNTPPSFVYLRNISIIWFEPTGTLWIIKYMNISKHIWEKMARTKKILNE